MLDASRGFSHIGSHFLLTAELYSKAGHLDTPSFASREETEAQRGSDLQLVRGVLASHVTEEQSGSAGAGSTPSAQRASVRPPRPAVSRAQAPSQLRRADRPRCPFQARSPPAPFQRHFWAAMRRAVSRAPSCHCVVCGRLPPASCLWLQPTCRPAFGLSSGSSFCFVSPSLLVTHPIEAAIISLLPPTPSFISSSDRDFAFACFTRPVSLWRLRLSRWHHAVSRARRPLGLGLLPTSHTPSISRTDCASLRIASWAHALLSVPTWVAPVHVRPLHPQECGSGP